MRPIKIRIKDTKYKNTWVYFDMSKSEENPLFDKELSLDPETSGQFIGLLDRKDNEIFEGDIVNTYTLAGLPIRTGVIEFMEGVFVFHYANIKIPINILQTHLLEVIGNKFDNPELLKGGLNEKYWLPRRGKC